MPWKGGLAVHGELDVQLRAGISSCFQALPRPFKAQALLGFWAQQWQELRQSFLRAVKWKCFEKQELKYSCFTETLVMLSMELIFFVIIGPFSLAI